jgi:carboxylesterase type B
MSLVSDRIRQVEAREVIDLTKQEKEIYNWTGWHLARFVNGTLVELFELGSAAYQKSRQAMADAAFEAAMAWFNRHQGAEEEIWLVLCSCYELCNPEKISLADPESVARVGNIIGEIIKK